MWYRNVLLIFIALFHTAQLTAQGRYSDYSDAQRTDIFYDDFSDNRHGWFVGYERKGKREGQIKDGHYIWASNSDIYDQHATWNQISLNQTRDFEIETRLKFAEEDNSRRKSVALSWGRSDRGSFFFGIKNNKFYISDWHKIGGLTQYVKSRETPHIRWKDYNTLTVRKVDNTYSFFINEQSVFKMNFEKFYGTNVGFESSNMIHVDYLRVSYLNDDSPPPLANKSPSQSSQTLSNRKEASSSSTLQPEKNDENFEKKLADNLPAAQPTTQTKIEQTAPEATSKTRKEGSLADTSPAATMNNTGDRPIITITEPTLSRGFKQIAVQNIRIAGKATDRDGIREVRINDQLARLQPDGQFSLETPLHIGDNEFKVVATDRQQQSTTSTFSIRREEPAQERRLALVIGNSAYEQGGQLRNPINDANAMKSTLEGLGFTVMKYENCRQNDIKRAIDEFGKKLKDFDVGLFFYAGHGVQVDGSNYLIPVDAQLASAYDVEYDCVRADRVLAKMEAANSRTNIVMLDACRDNPFERSWSRSTKGNGLAFMSAPQGSLVAYATAPGQTASDGGGQHGIYTEALLTHLTIPNLTIEQVFKRVRATVSQKSQGKQIPWESTSLTGDFYFKK
ncbi:MAG: caspase family protein [Cyclobacteriaceae bacterium]